MKRTLATLLLAAAACAGCERLYVKQAALPADATAAERASIAGRVVPEPRQLAWQQLELTAFLHFGINTFTGREWGDGHEDPALFDPSELDADQWVRTLRDAGFRLVILTAKHHDGFCLWPTATTAHSVASSPWRDGRGDVVGELREACGRHGMRFGVYLSPWDRNAPCYGDSPRYNDLFIDQLTELLTRYGRVDEVWFDGACGEGPDGRRQEYDWERIYATIRRLQPDAVTAIMGDDVRWVGNEGGLGRTTEWSSAVLAPGGSTRGAAENRRLGINAMSKDLGGRDMLAQASTVYWYPSEVDVSIRPGWFYHSDEDAQVKPLKHLIDIYFNSVGRNSQLLLNIPPDRRGRIHAADSARLVELAGYLRRAFADDRVVGGSKRWRPRAGESREYALAPGSRINTLLLQEEIARGQRVEAFTVELLTGGQWVEVARGTTVGYKRLLRIPETEAQRLRITVDSARLRARIARVGAYLAPSPDEETAAIADSLVAHDGWTMRRAEPLTVDMGAQHPVRGLVYAPGEASPEVAYKYRFELSTDGERWTEAVADGEFGNMMYNAAPRRVEFGETIPARYFRLTASTVAGTPARVEMAHIGIVL